MDVALLTVGDELLSGDTENTNATWLADQLTERGVTVARILVVPDDRELLARKVEEYSESLFCRLAERIDSDAIDEAVNRCADEVQRPEKPEGASGLFQALLGQAAEFRQPRLQ